MTFGSCMVSRSLLCSQGGASVMDMVVVVTSANLKNKALCFSSTVCLCVITLWASFGHKVSSGLRESTQKLCCLQLPLLFTLDSSFCSPLSLSPTLIQPLLSFAVKKKRFYNCSTEMERERCARKEVKGGWEKREEILAGVLTFCKLRFDTHAPKYYYWFETWCWLNLTFLSSNYVCTDCTGKFFVMIKVRVHIISINIIMVWLKS